MTIKDYEMLAACFGLALHDNWDKPERITGILDVRNRVVLELELDNPRFNSERFLVAIDNHQVK